ncbi:monocarboxylate 2-oxoacid-binding periplasmic protein all3028-like [Ylistrum balloti]|uniref:monocarboxylate 2-oxoacid-binding periplasmic protein all3028-like n=1 Tax=Ylistrum balloti TaxID=509963 RepID=UPI002905DB84|nr:monocarboxylate 2-oxoacid-binding periplasmic protein all3028-like [Ylistrum balloti]
MPYCDTFIGDTTKKVLHGGILATLIDTAGAAAAFSVLDTAEEGGVNTIDMRIDFLKPARGKHFIGTGQVIRKGSRIVVTDIKVTNDTETLVAQETFDAVRQGTAEMGHGAAYYWAGKIKAAQFFTSVPFGLNAQQMYAWLYSGNGLQLWEELYAPFGLIPIPAGNSGVQMGGWFNKEINTLTDFKGLKIRIPGLGGKVLSEAGASPELLPGGEIYTSLERGIIDATEWLGPYHDYLMGFHKIAKHYYYPGWHEPGSVLELIINKRAFDSLDQDLQAIIQTVAQSLNTWMLARFDTQNSLYLKKLSQEKQIKITPFPKIVMTALKQIAQDTIASVVKNDPQSQKIYTSFTQFQRDITPWSNVSERAFYNAIQTDT